MQYRDINSLLAVINEGRALAEINEQFPEMVKTLNDLMVDQPKKTHKGSITIKIEVAAKGGIADLSVDVTTKTPKLPKPTFLLFPTKEGHFSDEHPKQMRMFDRSAARVIDGEVSIPAEERHAPAAAEGNGG